jgi:hypothetical protein
MKDTIKWRRQNSGHYILYAWYVWKEPEAHAEIIKERGKWRYRLWTWGTDTPEPLDLGPERFATAKEAKAHVIDLILDGEPCIVKRSIRG